MNYFVFAPTGGRAGGVECQVQLVDSLRRHGENAFLSFYPSEDDGGTIKYFKSFGYDISAKQPDDIKSNIIVLPEIITILAKKYNNTINVINWLSVDNYYKKKWKSFPRDLYNRYRTLTYARLPMTILRKYFHLAQSFYAAEYLRKHSIDSLYIGDYLNDEFYEQSNSIKVKKKNIISYNPLKGTSFTEKLQKFQPEFKMYPLQGLTRKELINQLAMSKIYIDFGHHPGRDRIPREAAIMNCCLITSDRGSAGNQNDIKIDKQYKFKINNRNTKNICDKISEIFNDYELHKMNQRENLIKILNDKSSYHDYVKSFVGLMSDRIR
tara:strand:+ start:7579 stop:8550 length:972 start_codon:yes stop_codon:yes gene_type:complete